MRANLKFRQNEQAQVGIGTMIVFIATVLVAAVAAGVLIDVSGKLQERSSRTGTEATEEVSGNFAVVSLLGLRDATSNTSLSDLQIFLQVAPGAPNMDVSQLRLQLKTATAHKTLDHAATATDANSFTATEVRDQDNSFDSGTSQWVVNGGDLVRINVNLDQVGSALATRTNVVLILVPEYGNKIEVGFLTPPSYGIQTKVILK